MSGLELRQLRKKFGFSRADFAEFIKISIHTLDSWEGGKRNIPKAKAELIKLKINGFEPVRLKKVDDELTKGKASEPEAIYNKNGNKFTLLPNGKYIAEVPKVPYTAYASFIEVFGDEYQINDEFEKTFFTVDHVGRGKYIAFTTANDSMNGGNLMDTPSGAEVLGRELQKSHWKDGFRITDYGFIIIAHNGIFHKDLGKINEEGYVNCISRNDSPEFPDFLINLNEVHSIFKIIKRTF